MCTISSRWIMASSLLSTVVVLSLLSPALSVQSGGKCDQALGLESGALADGMITASSRLNERRSAHYARLHQRDGDGSWTADPNDQNAEPSLTVDLGHRASVVAVATQGRYNTPNEYVRRFMLAYSADGTDWFYVMENGEEKIFEGNTNGDTAVKTMLPETLEARYIRFMPTTWSTAASMRVELYGCLLDVYSASFDGSNYLRWDLSSPRETLSLDEELIDFWFLTSEPDGIILSGYGTQRDYILIAMEAGKLRLSINLGTNSLYSHSTASLTVGSLLDDSHWHYGKYMRTGHNVQLMVDGRKIKGETGGDFGMLSLDREITLGGASEAAKALHGFSQNFKGCVQLVRISNSVDPDLLGIALDLIKEVQIGGKQAFSSVGTFLQGCGSVDTSAESSVTFPTQESYLKWTLASSGSSNFTVHIRFRTFDDKSMFLYNSQGSNQFIALGVQDSRFATIIKNGDQPVFIRLALNVNDGLWHRARVEVASGRVLTQVDDLEQTTTFDTSFVSTFSEYYIGGTTLMEEETAYLPGFRGCISEIRLQDTQVDVLSLGSSSTPFGVVQLGLQIDTCTLYDWCSPNPCEHEGFCSSEWDTFICDCTLTGYTGATCHSSNNELLCTDILVNGEHTIDVDGSGPLMPLTVSCTIERLEENTEYHWTEIGHDTETTMSVPSGNEQPGSYMRKIQYTASIDQIEDIIESSEECEQFIKYTCTNAKLLNSPNGPPYGWWVSRHDQVMVNWGGAASGTGRCACGVGMTCAPDNSKYCNCDAATTNGQVDEGYLTEKAHLPVTRLRFGDTGASGSSASYELGQLRCRGDINLNNVVSFVQREAHLAVDMETTPEGALDMTFDFKTTIDPSDPSDPATAAVFFAADAEGGGFIEGKLLNSTAVRLHFSYGAEVMTLDSAVTGRLNDNEWHTIRANFDRKEVWLKVDSLRTVRVSLTRPELVLELTGPLYIGSSTVQSDGFVGCMRKMRVNGELVDMAKMADMARDVHDGCIGQCSTDPCFNGGVCMEKYETAECQCDDTAFGGSYCSVDVGADFGTKESSIEYMLPVALQTESETDTVSLSFKTAETPAYIIVVNNNLQNNYIALHLDSSGYAVLEVRLGTVENVLTVSRNFADNKNHFVTITRNMKELRFQVDDYLPETTDGLNYVTTTFTPETIYVGISRQGSDGLIGCISRVQYNAILPLKLFFGSSLPEGLSGSGSIAASRCGLEEQTPIFLPAEEYPPTTAPTVTVEKPAVGPVSSPLAAGDKAAIAIVVILLLAAMCLLLFLIGRYTSRHKGKYSTNEDRGAKNAHNADDAVALQGSGRTKEYYM